MAGRPVHKRNNVNSREGLWEAIKRVKRFTLTEIRKETCLSKDTVRDYVTGLNKAGYLKVTEKGTGWNEKHQFKGDIYELVKCPRDMPRVRKNGSMVTQGRARLQMWRTMKVLKVFNARDLVVNGSLEDVQVGETDAKYYLRYLHMAGYLKIVKKGHGAGKGGMLTIYSLKPGKYTGPKAPMIQNVKHVYDPNLGEVVWPAKEANYEQ